MKAFESKPRQCLVHLEKDTSPNGSFISIPAVNHHSETAPDFAFIRSGFKTEKMKTFEKIAMFKCILYNMTEEKVS